MFNWNVTSLYIVEIPFLCINRFLWSSINVISKRIEMMKLKYKIEWDFIPYYNAWTVNTRITNDFFGFHDILQDHMNWVAWVTSWIVLKIFIMKQVTGRYCENLHLLPLIMSIVIDMHENLKYNKKNMLNVRNLMKTLNKWNVMYFIICLIYSQLMLRFFC